MYINYQNHRTARQSVSQWHKSSQQFLYCTGQQTTMMMWSETSGHLRDLRQQPVAVLFLLLLHPLHNYLGLICAL